MNFLFTLLLLFLCCSATAQTGYSNNGVQHIDRVKAGHSFSVPQNATIAGIYVCRKGGTDNVYFKLIPQTIVDAKNRVVGTYELNREHVRNSPIKKIKAKKATLEIKYYTHEPVLYNL